MDNCINDHTKQEQVMSMRIVKSLSHPLLLISAALLLDVSGAAAADSANDAQQQMRQVLAGRIETQSPPPYGRRDEGVGQPATDAREYAARLLLGGTTREQGTRTNPQSQSVAVPAPLAGRESSLASGDAQRWRGK
jgi:hypothetical protein